jgi:anti-anti-sigma regulatory factor
MTTTIPALWLKVNEERVTQDLLDACGSLEMANNQFGLDFSSVRRVEPGCLAAMEALAVKADEKSVEIMLCGVNVDVYKVLKLARLTPRFFFVNDFPTH